MLSDFCLYLRKPKFIIMKKLIIPALIMALVSCSKAEVESPALVKVRFDFSLVSEQPMTKSVNNDDIADWIEASLPAKLSLRLTDSEGVRHNIETGTEVELPVGIYTVTGKNTPTASASVVGSDVFFSVSRPTLTVSTTIEVTYSQKNYVIPATYGAFGIVIDSEETASATFASSHGETGNIEFATIGTSGIVFVNGNLGTHTLDVTLNPVNSADRTTTHTFKTAYDAATISPTFGNYYILHPKAQSSVDGGTFTYSVIGFRAVDVD